MFSFDSFNKPRGFTRNKCDLHSVLPLDATGTHLETARLCSPGAELQLENSLMKLKPGRRSSRPRSCSLGCCAFLEDNLIKYSTQTVVIMFLQLNQNLAME